MHISDFDIYKDMLKEKSGLVLSQDKAYLLESRLSPIAKKWGYANMDALTTALKGVPDNALIADIVDAMTTNETSFFRDQRPFDVLKNYVIPHFLENRSSQKRLKMWCAAASSGQEPYSVCMVLKEHPPLAGWNFDFVATDLSNEILAQAKEGVYSQFEVQRGLPIQLLMKYFQQQEERWLLSDDIKNMVKFEIFNLLDSMASKGSNDIIFCRNVLIYFDAPTKTQVLERMAKQLAPDGFLFLGGAETVIGITDVFKPVPDQRGLYALSTNEAAFVRPAA